MRGQASGTTRGRARTNSAINNTQASGTYEELPMSVGVSALEPPQPKLHTSTGPEGRIYSTAPVKMDVLGLTHPVIEGTSGGFRSFS